MASFEELAPVLQASVVRAKAAQRGWDGDSLVTAREVGVLLGISPATWRAYVSRGRAPEADDTEPGRPVGSRVHRWRVSTVEAYVRGKRRRTWKM